MSPSRLTAHDANVLDKIKDPESAAAASPIQIVDSLPSDPSLTSVEYATAKDLEKSILSSILQLQRKELSRPAALAKQVPISSEQRAFNTSLLASWLAIILRLDKLVEKFPNYSSALNNRAQALKTVYGDGMLVRVSAVKEGPGPHQSYAVNDGLPAVNSYTIGHDATLAQVGSKVLSDLTTGIRLLSPQMVFGAVSSTQAKTLSQLYMQRGALYRATAQKLALHGTIATENHRLEIGSSASGCLLRAELRITDPQLRESTWSSLEFEENASRDFMMAGRYGNDMGKGLAVSTNPTAKLCGEMVKEAMKKEFREYGG